MNRKAIADNKPSNKNQDKANPLAGLEDIFFTPTDERQFKQLPHYVIPDVSKKTITNEEIKNNPYHETNSMNTLEHNKPTLSESESKLYTMLTKKLYGINLPESDDYGEYLKYKAAMLEEEKNLPKESCGKRPKKFGRMKGMPRDVIQKYNNPAYNSDSDSPNLSSSKPLEESSKTTKITISDNHIGYTKDSVREANRDENGEDDTMPTSIQIIKKQQKCTNERMKKLIEEAKRNQLEASLLTMVHYQEAPQFDYLMNPKLRTYSFHK